MKLGKMIATNVLLRTVGGVQYQHLVHASRNPRAASERVLRQILSFARDTVYGREHRFGYILEARNADELFSRYAELVPANEYEDLRPYIERHKHGEGDILFPGKPVLYATTSGSTAEPKWIPITHRYLKTIYGKMTRVWLYNYMHNRPWSFAGKALIIVGRAVEGYAPDGTIFGSVSGLTQRDCPEVIKRQYSNPHCVYSITDYTARYYALMRIGIEQDVTILGTANPSTIVELQNNVDRYFDDYIIDIEHGTLKEDMNIEPDIRRELEAKLKPNPHRAAELRAMRTRYGRVLPRHFWPNLQILATWKCGNTKVYLNKIKGMFPDDVLHQELGYFASECRFGLVLDESVNTVLFPHMHYYEFVREEELDAATPRFYRVDELEEGGRYCPFVTTLSGLYRYNMHDLLEVGPCFKNTPTVHMIQKTHGIVSLTGEKLYEQQFIEAVHRAERKTGLDTRFFVGFAEPEHSRYSFYYEFADQTISQADAEQFTMEVDCELKEINIEYKAKRESLRLKDPMSHRLVRDAFEHFKERCIKDGARDGQFKFNLLMDNPVRQAKFNSLIIGVNS